MKKRVLLLAVLLAAIGLVRPPALHAAVEAQITAKASTPGVQIAQTLSMITGVAISPLLGVSAVGCYQYFKCNSDEQKAKAEATRALEMSREMGYHWGVVDAEEVLGVIGKKENDLA